MRDASLDNAGRDFAAVAVEQRQLSARFRQTARQISVLGLRRPQRCRNLLVLSAQGILSQKLPGELPAAPSGQIMAELWGICAD
jgi:hypothetical protein